ncbi:PIR Superfamily Protein [Plasmodium ovale curtisi]|uniref:PIR Superfamily Protein n=1 Tax=Plasmodium ovale curtisi TaxID=864141 RepID=A0A1A8WCX5_PLAOA|nr:PIR Superfamily Protein [Plasmodium ovale curtisi]
MSPHVYSTDFYKLFSNSSKELFSDQFYEALNSDSSDLSKYDHECNEITVHHSRDEIIKIYNTDKISTGFSTLQFVWGYFDYYKKDEPYYLKRKPNLEIDKKSLYEYFEQECLPPKKNCPEFYEKCKEYKHEKILFQLRCYDKMIKKKPSAEALTISQNAKQELEPEAPRYGSDLPGKEDGSHDAEITPGVSQIGTTISHSILGVTPVLLTASALYRVSAYFINIYQYSSWIRNLSGNNANSINNVDGEMEVFLGNTQESGNMFFEGRENYISYQPM